MNNTHDNDTNCKLQDIPAGTLHIQTYFADNSQTPLILNELQTSADGRGKIEIFHVYPGIELAFNHYHATTMHVQHAILPSILEINYCISGRIGWTMRDGSTVYLGCGDLSIQTMDWCAASQLSLPLGYYTGISVFIDIEQLSANLPPVFQDLGISSGELCSKLSMLGKPLSMDGNKQIESIFALLQDLPAKLRTPYYRLKMQELLIWLISVDWTAIPQLNRYQSEQVHTIKAIHAQLTNDLAKRFTIQELAKQYLLNTTTLKNVFKNVYGDPIATYMKKYRLNYAADKLRETTDSIALIAAQSGYQNQGKFTVAFKDEFQMLPTQYRRLYHK